MKPLSTERVWNSLLLGAIAILTLTVPAAAQLSVEQVQRDFQVRYRLLNTNSYLKWPQCSKGLTPAPQYPKDGFYGDLTLDHDKGVEVVQDLVQKFYTSNIIYTAFVKAPNGYSDLEGASSIVNYTAADMTGYTNNVTTNNYFDVLGGLAHDIAKLGLIKVQATQVVDSVDGKETDQIADILFDSTNLVYYAAEDCAENAANAVSAQGAAAWTDYVYDSYYSTYGTPPLIQRYFESVGLVFEWFDNSVPTNYFILWPAAVARNIRGKIAADLTPYGQGSAAIYLQLKRLSVTTGEPDPFYTGLDGNTFYFAQTRPTSATENNYGLWPQGALSLGTVSTSSVYVTYSDVVPEAMGDCPADVPDNKEFLENYGWKVADQVAVVAPDFTVIPDMQDCCSCTKCDPGTPSCYLQSIHVNIPLGGDNYDSSAGALILDAAIPSTNLATPAAIRYTIASTVGLISDGGNPVEHLQFLTSQSLIDVATNNPYFYTISCYLAAQAGATNGSGFYAPTNSPYATVTVQNPDASTNTFNRLRITTVTDSNTNVTDYTYTASTGQWEMDTGSGLRKETRVSVWTNNNTIRTETVTVSNAANQVLYQEVNTWQLFPWGQEIVTNVVDPNGAALMNAWSFYTNAATDGGAYRQVKQIVDYRAHWVTFQYDSDGRETNRVTQFLNSAIGSSTNLNRVTVTTYSTNVPNITTIDYLQGTEVGRDYKVVGFGEVDDYRCQTRGAAWTASDNLLSVTKKLTSGPFRGQLLSIQNPDGTVQFYSYSTNSSQKNTVVLSGVPDPASATNILMGTETYTVTALGGQILSNTVKYKAQGGTETVTGEDTYAYLDPRMRSYEVVHLDGTTNQYDYACCGLDFEIDRDGTETQYSYDTLKRQIASLRIGITTSNILDANGSLLITARVGTNGSQIVQQQMAYDVAGRVRSETNALGGVITHTNYFDGSGQMVVLSTNWTDLSTRIEIYAQDGSLVGLSGTAVHPVTNFYGVDAGGAYTTQVRLNSTGGTNEWTKTYADMAGRSYKTVYAAASGAPYAISYFNNQGQLIEQVDPDNVFTLYAYNSKGEQAYTALDTNQNQSIDLGVDEVTFTTNDVVSDNGINVHRTRTYAFPTSGSTNSVLLAEAETSVDGLRSWNILYNKGAGITNFSQTVYQGSGARSVTNIAPDGSYVVSVYQNGLITSTTSRDANGNQLGATTYGYDPHARQNAVTDARTGTITSYYNNGDQVTNTVMPTVNGVAESTTYYFDTMGRLIATLLPDSTWTSNKYTLTGQLQLTYGSRTYAAGYRYDAQGRMTTMTNWSSAATGTGARVTTWNYDQYRGFMTNKVYDGNQAGPSYTYTSAGRLATRLWARGITTTYSYDTIGQSSGISYSDGVTPSVSYTYDRRGRQTVIVNGSTTCTHTYDDAGDLLTESYSGGPLNGISITNGYDGLLRRTNLVALNGSTVLSRTAYGYDTASRLFSVSDGTNTAAYSYVANSPLVSQIAFTNAGALRMTTTKNWDNLNRMTSISSANASSVVLDSHGYAYNSANQRTSVTNADGSYWIYQYDTLGQVTSGKKYWSDGTPVAGEQFTYAFDDIGNRTETGAGGDQWGANLRYANYSANNLNQYTNRTVAGAVDILGEATNSATVTVNNQPTYRHGTFFRDQLGLSNSSGPVWQSVTNLAVLNQGTNADIIATNTGNIFLTQTPEPFTYDADGNLASDGRWTNIWDAENRLISMESLTNGPTGSKLWLNFSFDYQGRRIAKLVQTFSGSAWTSTLSNKFAYDGWNLAAELNGTNAAVIRAYMWGSDLSGTMQGAGGVGGLLGIWGLPAGQFTCVDANANVTSLVDVNAGSISAQYEYDPFAGTLRASGSNAKGNSFRWSTRYRDDETELVFYPARPYDPFDGRWLGRDPLQESAGVNVYGFQQNDSIQNIDPLGLQFLPSIQFGFKVLPTFGESSHEAETTFVGKSFINGLPRLGSLGSRKPVLSTAIAFASTFNGVTYEGRYADVRLASLSHLVLNTLDLDAFHEDPEADTEDGNYRLYTRVKIEVSCCDGKPNVKTLKDSDGGHELGPFWGTINMSSDITDTASGDKVVRWRGWGRPNRFLEPGMQLVASRGSVNIWHDITVIVSCKGDKPVFMLDKIETSRFPSFRLWQDGKLVKDQDQGSFSDLWQGMPNSLDFVAP
jgi:RHS repeat-associated protein